MPKRPHSLAGRIIGVLKRNPSIVVLACLVTFALVVFTHGSILSASAQPDADTPGGTEGFAVSGLPQYKLTARINIGHGYVKEACWLDDEYYLTLVTSPEGAAFWRTSYLDATKEKYISSQFIEKYICPTEQTKNLTFILSPRKSFMFLKWFTTAGDWQWQLLDITEAPTFKIKRFEPPAGMQIAGVLFSPDDKYAIFSHDGYHKGSEASILAYNLETGVEHWRITVAQLNFITEMWWGGAVYGTPRFHAIAGLRDGQFTTPAEHVVCDLNSMQITPAGNGEGIVCGTDALWGSANCFESEPDASIPYYLKANIPNHNNNMQIPLTARPVSLMALPEPGLVLLCNQENPGVNQLWLVDVLAGDKISVDRDCASFSVSTDGKLLVKAYSKNQLRIYQLDRPE